jgi:hypothetical protein
MAFAAGPKGGQLRTYFQQFQLEASVAFHQRWRAELNFAGRDGSPIRAVAIA